MNGSKAKAYVMLSISTLLFGFSFLAGKTALNTVNNEVYSLLSFRFIVGWIALSLYVIIKKQRISFKGKGKKNLIMLCLFSPVLASSLSTAGLARISSSEAGMFIAAIPIFSIIFSYLFFKEKIGPLRLIFMVVSIIGVFIINIFGFVQGNSTNIGRLLMLLMVISAALYLIFAKKSSKEYSYIEITWTMTLVGAIVFTSVAVAKNAVLGTLDDYIGVLGNTKFLLSVLYLGIGVTMLSHLSMNYAIPKLNVAIVAIFANLSPVIAVIAGAVFLKEALYWYHIVGGIVIIGGVLGASLLGKRDEKEIFVAEQL